MNTNAKGQILPIVMLSLVILALIISGLINWMQQDSKYAIKEQKSTDAVNFAEAGIDRGTWKLQSSTTTWAQASIGTTIAGYDFNTTYTDVPGGFYRIKFSSGPTSGLGNCNATGNCVTITAEGRDQFKQETRALQAVQLNQTIYSALMSGGNITWSRGMVIYWGPIISQGNITLADDFVAGLYFPLKYAKGVVLGTAANPRDINGLTPPNTDNTEWWSNYAGIPDVPVLDFSSLRSSAAATGTLNVYGCRSTQGGAGTNNSSTAWDTRASCTSAGSHATHFGNPWSHPKSVHNSPGTSNVWYWDGDVTLSGAWCNGGTTACGESTGLQGTFIVRGNLTIDTPGEYNYTGHVPTYAYLQQGKRGINTFDTGASAEYPADTGLQKNSSTFAFGTTTRSIPNGYGSGWYNTVGLKGFVYVGGNLTILQFMDFHGAVWVNGTTTASGGDATHTCFVMYDDTLIVPSLNVILLRQSWKETTPSTTAWN